MKTYRDLITEVSSVKFNNWIKPSKKDLELEYKIEYSIKPLKNLTGNAFPLVADFIKAANEGIVLDVNPQLNKKIQYRSNTKTKNQLLNLIKGYASYPEFRNENTIDAIYRGFAENKPMKMPLVLEMPDGSMRIMSGNTRADIAFQMNINPKMLLIRVPKTRS